MYVCVGGWFWGGGMIEDLPPGVLERAICGQWTQSKIRLRRLSLWAVRFQRE